MPDILRRRRGQDADEQLEEPLLGRSTDQDAGQPSTSAGWDSSGKDRGGREASSGCMAIVPRSINRIDWEELWRVVWGNCCSSWNSVLASISSCLGPLIGKRMHPQQLSAMQETRLQDLRTRMSIPFDSENPDHMDGLRRLWGHAFPGAPWQGLVAAKWTDMGWQRDDPSSDFRGAGLVALQNLLFMAQDEPALFGALLGKTQGTRSDWEYPFAVAGVNLTFALQELLELRDRRLGVLAPPSARPPAGPPARAFLALLPESECVFESMYCMAFELLDREWLAMGASYMDFPAVMKRVEHALERSLSARPATLAELRALLLAP